MRLSAALVSLALVLGLLAAPAAATSSSATDSAGAFLVGVGQASTAPNGQVCMGGYGTFCRRPSQGIKDPLAARGLAVTGGNGETLILVTTTAVGYFAAYKDELGPNGIYEVRQRIAEQIPVPADNIVVVSDHSHAAPDTIGIWGGVGADYMKILADGAVAAGVAAFEDRRPADLSVGTVVGPNLDSSYDRGPTDDAAMDDEFRALFADSPDGDRIATFVNYAPHATVCEECNDEMTADWTVWAAQEAEARWGGQGFGAVGALGATDWRKDGDLEAREGEARTRIRTLLGQAHATRRPVLGTQVAVETTFIREPMAQPVLLLNYIPGGVLNYGEGDVRIDRAVTPPFLTGGAVGTHASAIRLGDVFMSTFPGEPFPQLSDALRDTVAGPQAHFLLGAANDFLGYMVADDASYQQTLEEGALFLPGCPEEAAYGGLGVDHDGACPDHWTLMVSPTIGRHIVCTVQDGAERLGFEVTTRADECGALTATDGQGAPAEHPGADDPVEPPPTGGLKAGVGSADVSWHLGASGGQFAEHDEPVIEYDYLGMDPGDFEFEPDPQMPEDPVDATLEDGVDPYFHATRKEPADAIYSRILTRALVVEDGAGDRVAVIGNDLYLPNDILNRRVADLLEEHDLRVTAGLEDGPVTGITADNLAVTVSHNHNSAFYSTPSWGTWVFQDVFDLRFFDYYARGMADAVIAAAADLRPVRMGGATVPFNEITSHTYGPKVAIDGTPAGQPYDHTTGMLSVVRFDDVSDPANPVPYANWVTLGVHPEWTWGYDVFNGDVTHAAMKIIDRELGTTTVMSQRETGSSGPHKDTRAHAPEARREFQDNGFENLDIAARMWADKVREAYAAIEQNLATEVYDPDAPRRDGGPIEVVPFATDVDVASTSVRLAPPKERPVPGVSNCNTSSLFHGNWQLPILGFPDCENSLSAAGEPIVDGTPFEEREIYDQLKAAGVPIPDSYFGPSLTAVEETAAVHLMTFKLGDIAATFCPCEQFTDTALNIQTRLDRTDGNEWVGWDWTRQTTPDGRDWCVQNEDTTWTCANPQNPRSDLAPVSDLAYRRMVAQINNDAAGWEDDLATAFGSSEPADPDAILGNFTHGERTEHGYGMVVAVGMANDYFGYMPAYREMRAHEHYRKALNGLGPHGADYLATRLVTMAAALNGGQPYELSPADLAYQAESARVEALTVALGELAAADHAAWEAAAYLDGGAPAIESQPQDMTRFSATHVTFVGGSNWNDMPVVRVERLVDGAWVPYADEHGDVPVMVDFPSPEQLPEVVAGQFAWRWTASFEAFASQVTVPDASGTPRDVTPAGTYRFVIDGNHRSAPGSATPYHLESEPFEVAPWDGVEATATSVSRDGASVSFGPSTVVLDPQTGFQYDIGPIDYPDGYASPFEVLNGGRKLFRYDGSIQDDDQWYCPFCRFHPWVDSGAVAAVTITVEGRNGKTAAYQATEQDGWWSIDARLKPGDTVYVAPGGAVTEHGEINGARIDLGTVDPGKPGGGAAALAASATSPTGLGLGALLVLAATATAITAAAVRRRTRNLPKVM